MRILLISCLTNLLLSSVASGADLEDHILQVLTPEQAQAYADGIAPEEIDLSNGETLAEYVVRQERKGRAGLVLRPVDPCVILDSSQAVEKLIPGYSQSLFVRGEARDLGLYGGSTKGCGIPDLVGQTFRSNRARALLLSVKIRDAMESGTLTLGSSGSLVAFRPGKLTTASSLIVPLCGEENADPCADGDLDVLLDGQAEVEITVQGFLEPMEDAWTIGSEETEAEATSKASIAPFWEKRTDSDDIYYHEGAVGIRTDAPEATLHVRGADAGAIISQPSLIQGASNYFEPDYPTLKLFRGSNSRGALLSLGNQDGSFYLYGSDSTFRIYDSSQVTRFLMNNDGFVGLGTGDPKRTLHIDGGFLLRDPNDHGILVETLQRSPSSYASGSAHDSQVLKLNTAYEDANGLLSRGNIVLSSPEIWGAESAYLYGFGNKNIRLGAINDSYRRAEIEIFNDNTSQGKILFRTGSWRDPNNVPGNDTNVRMMIDHSGNVGIGTTTPTEKFEVDGSVRISGEIQLSGTARLGNTIKVGTQESAITDGGNGRMKLTARRPVGTGTGQAFTFSTCDAEGGCFNRFNITGGSISLRSVSNGEAVRITDANRVGIGTASPSEKLEVDGNIKLSGSLVSDGDICIGQCG